MADGKFALKSGKDYLPGYNWEPGMNDDLAYSDRAGWTTSLEMLTGGAAMDWGMFGSLEVAPSQYEMDVMGEERGMGTFSASEPAAKGKIGMAEMEMSAGPSEGAVMTTGGKRVNLTSPQTYSDVGRIKR